MPETQYKYESVELSEDADGRLVQTPTADRNWFRGRYGGVPRLDCFSDYSMDRSCLFEAATLDGNVTGQEPRFVGDARHLADGGYVVLEGRIYERTATFSKDERFELGLERVDTSETLGYVSVSSGISDEAKMAIREGNVTTDHELRYAHHVLKVDGRYYVVYKDHESDVRPVIPTTARILEAFSVVTGSVILLREQMVSREEYQR